MHKTREVFECTSGPHNARVVIVGEFWGEQEEKLSLPFMGSGGQELSRMLKAAEIERRFCLLTSVLNIRPPGGKIEGLCGSKTEVGGKTYLHPAIKQGKYLKPEFLPELARLKSEIEAHPRTLIIALGNTACWALLGTSGITAIRGSVAYGKLCPTIKCIATYSPNTVLANWAYRPIVVADLMKAERESFFPEIRRPQREVIVEPTLRDIIEWSKLPASKYAVDIETLRGQISMIGFARSMSDAIVIPFVKPGGPHYWPNEDDEREAWLLVQGLLESPVEKIFQNGLYDLQYIVKMGFRPRKCLHDTMLMHHSMYPELPKGLGFLGSIYTNEGSWKLLRKEDSNKKDE